MGIVSIASDFNRRTTGLFKMVLITSGMMGIVSIASGFNRRREWIFFQPDYSKRIKTIFKMG